MTVHNLRDMGRYLRGVAPYSKNFDDALNDSVTKYSGEERQVSMAKLFDMDELHRSHPTKEHL